MNFWYLLVGALGLLVLAIFASGCAFCVWLNSFDDAEPVDVTEEVL